MPIYQLTEELAFPPVTEAEDGILAVGGDLTPERLLLAYRSGIFPWYSYNEPIIWWSPDPRFVLFPPNLKVSRSMAQFKRNTNFRVSIDTAFEDVIKSCAAQVRDGQLGTWITDEMLSAYNLLFQAGYAHSVEVWDEEELVGGLYGVSLGKLFFGESMFFTKSNASKLAFHTLVDLLKARDFDMMDCQVETKHLTSMGAVNIPRNDFIDRLHNGLNATTLKGSWSDWLGDSAAQHSQ